MGFLIHASDKFFISSWRTRQRIPAVFTDPLEVEEVLVS